MPLFFTLLAKKYNPYDIDNGIFAMNCAAPRSLPIVCTKMIADDGYGTATVNGKPMRCTLTGCLRGTPAHISPARRRSGSGL